MWLKNQTGSALVVVIVILAIATLGTLGFVMWQNMQSTPKTTQESKPINDADSEQKNPKYISLSDWGVKLQLPEKLTLDNVKYSKSRIAEAPEYYSLSTTKIFDQGDECSTGYPFGDIVSLQRSTDHQYAKENAEEFGGEINNGTPLNGYIYYYQTSIKTTDPVPSCAVTDIANSERELLIEMVKSLTAL